jgi:D-glycero-D-manno-heptose 1,7-bisphosphate phosphatase
MNRAIFLDRDNTLIQDKGYIHRPEDVVLLPGVAQGLALLKKSGYLLIVVSNQSGIGRGYYTERDFHAVNARLQELLAHHGVKIDDFFFCPHTPEDNCRCRKPQTGMLERAVSRWNVALSQSFVVGDKDTDVLLALNAGCKGAIRVGIEPFTDFLAVARFVLRTF